MGAARLGPAAEENDLVPELEERLADGEGEGLDAADFGLTGEIEGGVGQENSDLQDRANLAGAPREVEGSVGRRGRKTKSPPPRVQRRG
jgi:hypothetical protein